ncbi:hypothetical protein TNCV_1191381 [Trichonephila clavipes]|nr:hypothetical protein TNCV_1191381 [Trichonephila clavipes]
MMETGWSARQVAHHLGSFYFTGGGIETSEQERSVARRASSRDLKHSNDAHRSKSWCDSMGCHRIKHKSLLILIHGSVTAQRCVRDVPLRSIHTIVCNRNICWHTLQVSQEPFLTGQCSPSHKGFYRNAWPSRSEDLLPIKYIWDHLARQVGHPMSLVEQQWYEMSHDNIRNLSTSIPDHLTSCIDAIGAPTAF